MNATWAALLGALVGAIAAIISAALASFVALRNEHARQEEARRVTDIETLREHTALAFAEFFAFQHAINWVTWRAKYDPAAINDQLVSSYNAEIHQCYPRLLGSVTMVAALSLNAYQELRPLMQEIFDLDEEVAVALRNIRADRESALAVLQNCLEKAYVLEKTLPPELARIIKGAEFDGDR